MNKVLHIGQLIGGLDIYIRTIIKYSNDDFEFVVVHGKDDNSKPIIKDSKIIKEHKVDLYRKINPFRDILCIIQTIKIIREEKPDVIHCHSAKGGLIGRAAGFFTKTKTYYTPHAFSFLSTDNGILKNIYLFVEKYLKFNSYLLACSESERNLAITRANYAEEKAQIWHNSVPDVSKFVSTNIKGLSSNYVCYVGRPSYQKNSLFLVDVIRKVVDKLPNFKMLLLGVGYHSPELKELEAKISKYNLSDNITLIPWLPQEETFAYIQNSLFYLSVSRYEGLPLSVLEAMALSKALILSDVSGNMDCVTDNKNGLLLPLDQVRFSESILELWNNSKKRDAFSVESRKKYLCNFQIENQILKLQVFYSS
jgi:glycosyltransferase involved in cell wall biosynthesis